MLGSLVHRGIGDAVPIRYTANGRARSKTDIPEPCCDRDRLCVPAIFAHRGWLARLGGQGGHSTAIGVHPVTDALCTIEPESAARVTVDAGIVAQVAVLARTGALLQDPSTLSLGELSGRSH